MHLVQLFLPLYDNEGHVFPKAQLDGVRATLTDRFGGVTAYVRSPAVGAWEDEQGHVSRDDVVLLEVMVDTVDADWWRGFREELEARFRQDEIMLRATPTTRL